MLMALTACSSTSFRAETSAVCDGLENPAVQLVEVILEEGTPNIRIAGAKFALAYRAACDG